MLFFRSFDCVASEMINAFAIDDFIIWYWPISFADSRILELGMKHNVVMVSEKSFSDDFEILFCLLILQLAPGAVSTMLGGKAIVSHASPPPHPTPWLVAYD